MPLRSVPPDHAQFELVKTAFNEAVQELAQHHPDVEATNRVKEELVVAILDLVSATQTDPRELVRYAVEQVVRLASK